jgi:hypothetical protein
MAADVGTAKKWPGFNGKSLILWLVAKNYIDKREPKNLEILFSPGDDATGLEDVGAKAYDEVTLAALQSEGPDWSKLTSYAGRRNKEQGHRLSSDDLSKGSIVICDDDIGGLHHPKGLVIGHTNARVFFAEWSDLNMAEPQDPKNAEGLLGENSPNDDLKHMSSGS